MFRSLLTLVVPLALTAAACTRDNAHEPKAPAAPDLVSRPGPGETRIGRIIREEERLRGGSTDNAVGDWKLMNHDAVFVVHDVGDSGVYIMGGGSLIDADLWRDGDSWDLIYDYAPLAGSVYHFDADSITVEADGTGENGEAVLRVDGYFRSTDLISGVLGMQLQPRKPGMQGTTRYRLKPDSTVLEIETVITNRGTDPMDIPVGDLLIPSDHFGDPYLPGSGFTRPRMEGEPGYLAAVGERNEATFALFPPAGEGYELPLPASLLIRSDLALFIAPQTRCTAEPGESCSWRRFAVLAESPARAQRTALRYQGLNPRRGLAGRVVGEPSGEPVAGARVFATAATDPNKVVDFDITDSDGRFEVDPGDEARVTIHVRPTERGETAVHPDALPPVAQAEGYLPAEAQTVEVAGAPDELLFQMKEPARVTLRIADTAGVKLPGKFSFALTEGTIGGNTTFGEYTAYGSSSPQAIAKVVWQAHGDDIDVLVAPGTYDVIASHGFAYELDRIDNVALASGEHRTLEFSLTPAIDMREWAQCDTHVHTSFSLHGRTSHTDRIMTLVSEGLDCVAITDHDRIIDFQPLVRQLGLEDRILTFPALEVTTFLFGHINVFSLTPDPTKPNNGAIRWWEEGQRPPLLFQRMRDIGGRVVQINHGGGATGYFNATGYDPATGLGGPEFSPRFDVMELMNGKRRASVPELKNIAFSLWDRGRRKSVVGVSDSHRRIPEPGYARTLVRVDEDWHDNREDESILRAFLNMDAVVSNGVVVDLHVGEASFGKTITGDTQQVDIRIQSPTWIRLAEANLIFNGEIVETFDLRGTELAPLRLDITAPLTVAEDGWVVLEVLGEGDMWPVAPGGQPYAMTNPLFVDADGDGWKSPLPTPAEGEVSKAPAPHAHPHRHPGLHGEH